MEFPGKCQGGYANGMQWATWFSVLAVIQGSWCRARFQANCRNGMPECFDSKASARGNSPRLITQYTIQSICQTLSFAKDFSNFSWTSFRAPWQHETAAQSQPRHPFFAWLYLPNWCEWLVWPAKVSCLVFQSLAIGSGPQNRDKSRRYMFKCLLSLNPAPIVK